MLTLQAIFVFDFDKIIRIQTFVSVFAHSVLVSKYSTDFYNKIQEYFQEFYFYFNELLNFDGTSNIFESVFHI